MPWHEFVPVNMAKFNPEAGPLDPSKVSSLGLVYSRFDLNQMSNPNHSPGARPAASRRLGMPVRHRAFAACYGGKRNA